MKPFRWNIEKENELGGLVRDWEQEDIDGWLDEFLKSAAKVLAYAGDAHLYFVGRSPENYFDYLKGTYASDKNLQERFHLFQFSARYYSLEELKQNLPMELGSLKNYMTQIGLSPDQILKRKCYTTFVDLVLYGYTYEILIQLLKDWTLESKMDWPNVQKKIRLVGLTIKTKNSPNTWRWQQEPIWADLLPASNIKNVSIPRGFWSWLGDAQNKVTASFSPKKWNDQQLEKAPLKLGQLEGLRRAFKRHQVAQQKAYKDLFRQQLTRQKEMNAAWFRKYVLNL